MPCIQQHYHSGTVNWQMGQKFLRQCNLFDNVNIYLWVRQGVQVQKLKALETIQFSECLRQSIPSHTSFKTWRSVFWQQT